MSSKLNRAARRAGKGNISNLKEQIFFEEKDNLKRHLEKAEAEMRDSFEHLYFGVFYSVMAIAMHKCGLCQNTIYKAMGIADDLCGKLHDGDITIDKLQQMSEEQAGIRILFTADHDYTLLVPFEEKKAKRKAYYNITGLEVLKKIREGEDI